MARDRSEALDEELRDAAAGEPCRAGVLVGKADVDDRLRVTGLQQVGDRLDQRRVLDAVEHAARRSAAVVDQ